MIEVCVEKFKQCALVDSTIVDPSRTDKVLILAIHPQLDKKRDVNK